MRRELGGTQIPEFLENESLTTDFAETQKKSMNHYEKQSF